MEACYNACPKKSIGMKFDEEGFLYPQVNQTTCIKCGLCEKACPIINYVPREKNENQVAYLLQHKDDEICSESTAGGAFTGIASYVIEKGGIVFGVEMTEDYKVRHAISYFEDKKEYKLTQAAMYWQIQFGIEAYVYIFYLILFCKHFSKLHVGLGKIHYILSA